MKIEYRTGNLLDCSEKIILHGCNAQCKFKSGVAKAVREKYPLAYEAYKSKYDESGLHLGEVIWVYPPDGKIICNGITQEYFGKDGALYVDYDAIRTVIQKVNCFAKYNNIDAVAMPTIGAGLGGGSWKVISEIIEEESKDFQPVVYLLDGNLPNT